MTPPTSEIAPSGKLRVGINVQNFLLVSKYSPGAEPQGIAPDLGRELARRLGVPFEYVVFDSAGRLADAVKSGAWDVAFLGNEPQRAQEIGFSPAYLEIEAGYLVPAGSPIRTMAEVDREGVRVAVAQKSAYDLYLTRNLKHAKLVRADGIDASYRLFVEQKLEALAGLKPRLVSDAEKLPGSRVLAGRFSTVQQSIGTPREREAALEYLRKFVADAKASGLVAGTIEKHGVRGVAVAP
jgi:polar amino acid transport system substrate-binding protein